MFGRPNSLLNAAAPIGPSSMICSAGDDALGLAEVLLPRLLEARDAQVRDARTRPGPPSAWRRGRSRLRRGSRRRSRWPRPGNGEIAVGWLCVSTFIRMSIGSSERLVVAAARLREPAPPVPAFDHRRVVAVGRQHAAAGCARACCGSCRTATSSLRSPSTIQSALKILCRQCSEFACANIISSTSVGSRPQLRGTRRRGSRSRRRTARDRASALAALERRPALRPAPARSRAAAARACANSAAAASQRLEHALGHAVVDAARRPRAARPRSAAAPRCT